MQSFLYENHWECWKKLTSRSWPIQCTLTYFFLINTLLFCWKIKYFIITVFLSKIDYRLDHYSSVRFGSNMNNKHHTLP